MIDSHAHLTYSKKYENITDKKGIETLSKAYSMGVKRILTIILENYTDELELIESINSKDIPIIDFAVGAFPEDIEYERTTIKELKDFLDNFHERVHAIGECGLDYHSCGLSRQKQYKYFNKQIELSNLYKLPLIIHTRPSDLSSLDAYQDMLGVLQNNRPQNNFVLHCYSTGTELLDDFLSLGAYISFAGNLTYPSASNVRNACKVVPLNRILSETDSPFLAPQKYRGDINESAYVKEVVKSIAKMKDKPFITVEQQIEKNYKRFLGF